MTTNRHGLYGLFWTEDRNGRTDVAMWAMERSKRRALYHARTLHAVVTRMDLPYGNGVWDAPTFRVCSDVIADYRRVG